MFNSQVPNFSLVMCVFGEGSSKVEALEEPQNIKQQIVLCEVRSLQRVRSDDLHSFWGSVRFLFLNRVAESCPKSNIQLIVCLGLLVHGM